VIAKFIVAAALAASLIATSAAAQAAAELLQKGIYTQETAGDADGAIQIYRQVIGSAGVPRAVAAQAQAHVVGALLQKGDLAGAGQQFGELARDYADQENMVSSTAGRLRAIAENGPGLVLGSFQNGRYRHYRTGVELTLPPDWSFTSQKPQPDGGDVVGLADSGSKPVVAFVWMKYEKTPVAGIADRLLERMQHKLAYERRPSDGYIAYRLRPEGVQHRTVGGQQALSALADYMNANGEEMTEYVMIAQSEKTRVFFCARAAVPDFPSVQARFELVVRAALVP
jgi:hypothetical protein